MRSLLLLSILAATLLAGCTTSETTFETPPQDAEGRYVIHMTSANRFQPENAQVPVGAVVVWIADTPGHDTAAYDGGWESAILGGGDSYTHLFDAAGDFDYRCRPHESLGMKGTIRVV